jgi:murein L,D-transpeptidase YafK
MLAALSAASVGRAAASEHGLDGGAPLANGPSSSIVDGSGAAGVPPAAWVPVPVPVADTVIVRKSERRLYLMRQGEVLRSYRIALGLVPDGPKVRAGDFRTPEGRYYLTRRNPRSDYFLSIQVSYPNDQDQLRAQRDHVDPGGAIMIHGLPNNLRHSPGYYARSDWTDGCIALSDSDMVEVWLMTRENTPIEIRP